MPVYRSAQGRPVDMSQLAAKHEKVRAVGNMNVNARGDVIDSNNTVIKDNTKRVKSNYTKTVNKPQQKPQRTQPQQKNQPALTEINELSMSEKELFDDNDEDIKK